MEIPWLHWVSFYMHFASILNTFDCFRCIFIFHHRSRSFGRRFVLRMSSLWKYRTLGSTSSPKLVVIDTLATRRGPTGQFLTIFHVKTSLPRLGGLFS